MAAIYKARQSIPVTLARFLKKSTGARNRPSANRFRPRVALTLREQGRLQHLGFEPVSADTQPVSGGARSQISDIEKSPSRDSLLISTLSVRDARNSSPVTGVLAANPWKCRHFREYPKFPGRLALHEGSEVKRFISRVSFFLLLGDAFASIVIVHWRNGRAV
jgi:hypothetical protein